MTTPNAQSLEGLIWPADRTQCCYGRDDRCVCSEMERALRGWQRGDVMPDMTDEQRELCLSEIGRVEGYTRADYEGLSDRDVASGVLSAWTDYCRDKGLL